MSEPDPTLRPERQAEDIDRALRPQTLDEFIGQRDARANLKVFIESANFRMTSGPVLAKAGDLAAILTNLEARDVLFIDEIHRLNPAVEEVLYPALEDFELDLVIGEGPAARTVRIELQPFTLVGATTAPVAPRGLRDGCCGGLWILRSLKGTATSRKRLRIARSHGWVLTGWVWIMRTGGTSG